MAHDFGVCWWSRKTLEWNTYCGGLCVAACAGMQRSELCYGLMNLFLIGLKSDMDVKTSSCIGYVCCFVISCDVVEDMAAIFSFI